MCWHTYIEVHGDEGRAASWLGNYFLQEMHQACPQLFDPRFLWWHNRSHVDHIIPEPANLKEFLEWWVFGRVRDVWEGKVHCQLLILWDNWPTLIKVGTKFRHRLLLVSNLRKGIGNKIYYVCLILNSPLFAKDRQQNKHWRCTPGIDMWHCWSAQSRERAHSTI